MMKVCAAVVVGAVSSTTTTSFQPVWTSTTSSCVDHKRLSCSFRSNPNTRQEQGTKVLLMARNGGDDEDDDEDSFWGGLLKNAFANDENLSRSDFRQGQLEGPGNDDNDSNFGGPAKTEVQKRWLEAERRRKESVGGGGVVTQAPVPMERLEGTKWELQLYLAGISEVVDDGSSSVPRPPEVKTPTVAVQVTLLPNSTCLVDPSPFTKPALKKGEGDTVDEDASMWQVTTRNGATLVEFSFSVVGYVRTVTTTGTRSGVSWSRLQREAQTQQSQRRFVIPPGPLQGQFPVMYGSQPGQLSSPAKGPLFVERRLGLFGWGSKMEECGKVQASMVKEETEEVEEPATTTTDDTNPSVSEESASSTAATSDRGT